MTADAFAGRVRAALAQYPLARELPAAYGTIVVVDGGEADERLEPALFAVVDALGQVGVPATRAVILVGCSAAGTAGSRAAHAMGAARPIELVQHDPERPGFLAGRLADGTPIELDDEIREAEAIVTVGHASQGACAPVGGVALLCPGVATRATRAAYERACAHGARAAWDFARDVEALVPVNLAVSWDDAGVVAVGRGTDVFAAHARAAGCA